MSWRRGEEAIEEAIREAAGPGAVVTVGWAGHVGEGVSRKAWRAEVEVRPDPHGLTGAWVALVPRPGEPADARAEARLLDWLGEQRLPFRVPRALVAGDDVLVRQFLAGFPLDMRDGRQFGDRPPWEVIGDVAAAVHALAPPDWLPGPHTRRDHALAELACFDGLDDPTCVAARAWGEAHLPPDEPATLLHGDLLGQNILVPLDGPPALIDWEYARRGDPAQDLAIVTRGVRRPFQVAGGLSKLLRAHGRPGVTEAHVHLYEMCMIGAWYRDALEDPGAGGHGPEYYLQQLRAVLGRGLVGG